MKRLAQTQSADAAKREISIKIINNLRKQPAEIDGIGTGKHHAVSSQLCFHGGIGKYSFHGVLGIVKIALNGADFYILPFLGLHLALLHLADAVFGVKHEDPSARHIPKALQRGLTCIAGGSRQNHSLLTGKRLSHGLCKKMRQNLQRHILKGTGRTMPQFQKILLFTALC